jgi:tetratricopeptide (TPR) repeat protein
MMFLAAGDHTKSIEELEKSICLTKDPVILYTGKMLLGLNYLSIGLFQEAEENLNEHLILTQHLKSWVRKSQGYFLLNAVLVAKGDLGNGIKRLQKLKDQFYEKGLKSSIVIGEYILGKIYHQMASGNGSKDFGFIINNIGFLIKTIPFASKKAKNHYMAAIQLAKEIGAEGLCGQSYLDLGRLCMIKRKNNEARKYISEAIKIFEECKAYVLLQQAKKALESLS